MNKWILSFLLFIFLSLRLMLMVAAVPKVGYLFQYSGYANWSVGITEHADGLPVVFQNSYQLASVYGFHTSKIPFSFNTIDSRINQFSLSNNDDAYNGKIVKVYQQYSQYIMHLDSMNTSKEAFHYYVDSNFYVVNNLWISPVKITLNTTKDSVQFECAIDNRGGYDLQKMIDDKRLQLVVSKRFTWDQRELVNIESDNFQIMDTLLTFSIPYSKEESYDYKLGFVVDNKAASINSSLLEMKKL